MLLLCSYFYSLAPLFSFSFPHVLTLRVSLIPPGHIASGILHRPFHPDISHPEFFLADIPPGCLTSGICPATVLPYPDVSHPGLKVNVFPPRDLKHVRLCMATFPKSNCVNVFSNSSYFKIISSHQNFLSFIIGIFL